jgi:two-component system NtrC family sensor kinase
MTKLFILLLKTLLLLVLLLHAFFIYTTRIYNKIWIHLRVNDNTIPQKVVDKIFQPFSTTKPTGQGTGLGLSLGYDIIKAHGGETKVDTKESEGSEFIIHQRIDKRSL